MIILNNKKFISNPFESEKEIEKVVTENSEDIFGPDSIFLPKKLIFSEEGTGTIPDGFAIDIAIKQWYIIEAELSSHNVWSHIAPQIAKQLIAASQPSTRAELTELVVNLVKEDDLLQEKFEDLEIAQIDIRRILNEIFENQPIVGIPIDSVGPDLREWAQTLKAEVKLWIVRKLVEFGNPSNILYEIPDEYRPVFDTAKLEPELGFRYTIEDISLVDLIEQGLLDTNEHLFFSYKPRNRERKNFEAEISTDGTLLVLGNEFSSPSYAAVYCMQNVGSKRKTVNGWTSWRNKSGNFIAVLRDKLVKQLNEKDGIHK